MCLNFLASFHRELLFVAEIVIIQRPDFDQLLIELLLFDLNLNLKLISGSIVASVLHWSSELFSYAKSLPPEIHLWCSHFPLNFIVVCRIGARVGKFVVALKANCVFNS